MYIDGMSVIVGATIIGAFAYAAIRENHRSASQQAVPPYDREAALKHEATREQWRKILAEDVPLSQKNQQAYISFVCVETALKMAAAAGRGNRWTFKDMAEACELQERQSKHANELLAQIDAVCSRCDDEERLTGAKDGPTRSTADKLASEIEATLLEAGQINQLRQFSQMWKDWQSLPVAESATALRAGD